MGWFWVFFVLLMVLAYVSLMYATAPSRGRTKHYEEQDKEQAGGISDEDKNAQA